MAPKNTLIFQRLLDFENYDYLAVYKKAKKIYFKTL